MGALVNKDNMFHRFALYGFLKNLRFFDPFIILIFREGGLSFLQIGVLYSIRDLATNVLEIPTGVFADAFGRRKSMIMAFMAYIISFCIFYLFPSFHMYALAMVCFAFGEAFRSGTHKALILEHLALNRMDHLKLSYYGRTRAASQLGSAVNALIAAGLVFYTGSYRYMFLASIVPYVLDLFNLMTYPKELDGELVQLDRSSFWAQIKTTTRAFFHIFGDRHATRAMMNSAGFSALFKATKDYLQPILEGLAIALPLLVVLDDTKRAAVIVGGVYFIIYLLSSYASRSAAGISERFSSPSTAINTTFHVGTVLLLVAGAAAWQSLAPLAAAAFLALHLLQNVRRPMNVAFISDQISHRVMASGLSVESQFTTILAVVFAPILGALADHYGVGAALVVLGGGMFLLSWLVRVEQKSPDENGLGSPQDIVDSADTDS